MAAWEAPAEASRGPEAVLGSLAGNMSYRCDCNPSRAGASYCKAETTATNHSGPDYFKEAPAF